MTQGFIGREYLPIWDAPKKKMIGFELLTKKEPLMIDFSLKKHTFIVAKSGGGKSYIAGVIAEEIIRHSENYAVAIIDPIGNMAGLKKANINLSELSVWNEQLIRPEVFPQGFNVEIWIPEGDKKLFDVSMYDRSFSLKASALSVDAFVYAFDLEILDPMANLYRQVQKALIEGKEKDYEIGRMIDLIRVDGKDFYGFKEQTCDALITRLMALNELGIISSNGIELNEMLKSGSVAVFDLSMANQYTAKIVVSFFAEQILKTRKRIKKLMDKARLDSSDLTQSKIVKPSFYIPPIQLIIDEAHNYIPKNELLQKCIKEGRNVSFMLTCISQSADLNRHVYTNISHLFIGPCNYEEDIMQLKAMVPVEINSKDFKKQIKSLTQGCFWYFDIDEKTAKLIRVRPRMSFHPAETKMFDERAFFESNDELKRKLICLISNARYDLTLNDIPEILRFLIPECIREDSIIQVGDHYKQKVI